MAPPGIVADTDYLMVELTYGNRQRPAGDPMAVLGQVICDTAARGGGVIPAFAVGRAKALLYYLPLLKASSAIPASLPIFVDSQSFRVSEFQFARAEPRYRQGRLAAVLCQVLGHRGR